MTASAALLVLDVEIWTLFYEPFVLAVSCTVCWCCSVRQQMRCRLFYVKVDFGSSGSCTSGAVSVFSPYVWFDSGFNFLRQFTEAGGFPFLTRVWTRIRSRCSPSKSGHYFSVPLCTWQLLFGVLVSCGRPLGSTVDTAPASVPGRLRMIQIST